MYDFKKLENFIDSLTEEYKVPGAHCIVYQNHEKVFDRICGVSDLESGKKLDSENLFTIFSMTKMLTCTAALQLLERGRYLLGDPVSKYLPEFEKMKISETEFDTKNSAKVANGTADTEEKSSGFDGYAKNAITIKNLFTMTAGLDYDLKASNIRKAVSEGKTSTRELVRAISETVLGFEPGTRFRYSLCHDVLGGLVEVLSGKKLGDYMRENIFEPLGMKNTFFGVPKDGETLSRMVTGYGYNKDGIPEKMPLECVYNFTDEYQSGGAGLVSCCEDYALFVDAISCGGMGKTGRRILSDSTVELMKTNMLEGRALSDFNNMREGYGYGLGVRTHIDKVKSGLLSPIGEFGWDGAAGSFALCDTENKLSMSYFQEIHGWNVTQHNKMKNILYSCIEK